MLGAFFEMNQRAFGRIYRHFPHAEVSLWDEYARTVARMIDERPGQLVVDVGAGRECPYVNYLARRADVRVIGVDVAPEEIDANRDVDEKRVADVTRGIPVADGAADLVVSRYVLEHLSDVEAFFAHMRRVLKPCGRFVHFFSSRFAPFAVFKRRLPDRASEKLLEFFHWRDVEKAGFLTHHDRCYPTAMRRVLRRAGFELTEVRLRYCQSEYYAFFLPLALFSAVYEWAVWTLDVPDLAASVMIVGRKAP